MASRRINRLEVSKAFHNTIHNILLATPSRAVTVNAKVQRGQNILITGIGGGVAIIAMQICLAIGASVYVTSGNPDKIRRATSLGAKGGANYKDSQFDYDHTLTLNLIDYPLFKRAGPHRSALFLLKRRRGQCLMLLLILGEEISWVKQGEFSNKAVELYATECKSKIFLSSPTF
jgi:NADPH:quinone reductase-like Zn-dependent oxidoreductase